jgi:hypothetical protein
MLVFLLQSEFFTQAQKSELAAAIVAVAAAITLIAPLAGLWVGLKLRSEIAEIKGRVNKTGEIADESKSNRHKRAADDEPLSPQPEQGGESP